MDMIRSALRQGHVARLLVISLMPIALLASCISSSPSDVSTVGQAPDVGQTPDGGQTSDQVGASEPVWEFEFEGLNSLVTGSGAAVVATVESISEPQWNSSDGVQWENDVTSRETQALPMEYRDAAVTVERTLYSSTDLPLEVGASIELRLWGSGEATRGPVGDVKPTLQFNEISGRIETGDRRVFLLERAEFPMEFGLVPVVRVSSHFQGTWKIVNGVAESVDPRRNVPSVELLEVALVTERRIGRDERRDEGTRFDPLGVS